MLAGGHQNVCVVGDSDQSVYRFRGADISVWNEVEAAMRSHGRVLPLSRNFRCAPPIVDFVSKLLPQLHTTLISL